MFSLVEMFPVIISRGSGFRHTSRSDRVAACRLCGLVRELAGDLLLLDNRIYCR